MPYSSHAATQFRVSDDPSHNSSLSEEERRSNMEHDLVVQRELLVTLVRQNNKYSDYLQERIEREKESHEFWAEVRKKVAVSGVWGTIMVVGGVTFYGIKQWVILTGGAGTH